MRNFQPNIYAVEPAFMQTFLEAFAAVDMSQMESRILSQMESRLSFSQILNGEREPILFIRGTVATVRITGFLSPEGPSVFEMLFGFGGTSYADIREAVKTAAADESVERIVLEVDSPGGITVGLDETWQAIRAADAIKPVEAINTGVMASAAYWLSTAARKISSTSPINETGSIGVIIAGFDRSAAFEARGIKKVVIVSENAPNKDQSLWAGAGAEALQARVDAMERIFIQRVAEGRGLPVEQVRQTFGRGSVFVSSDPLEGAPDALRVGMIDAVQGVGAPMTESETETGGTEAAIKSPATEAGKTKEVKTMSKLTDFMAENPEAAAEVKTMTTNAKAEGHTAGKAEGISEADTEAKARAAVAAPFLAADSAYPAPIKALAAEVAAGTASPDALKSAAAAYDSFKEASASEEAAGEETEETRAAAALAATQPAASGAVETEVQFQAALQQNRVASGLDTAGEG